MKGRRLAALLCVLLAHALVVYFLLRWSGAEPAGGPDADFTSQPITLLLPPIEEEETGAPERPRAVARRRAAPQRRAPSGPATAPAGPAPDSNSVLVDWPLEGKRAAQRMIEREAQAERIARLFAGPKGTWASLTRRQRSTLDKFRFKPGVGGLEYDEKGNEILHLGA